MVVCEGGSAWWRAMVVLFMMVMLLLTPAICDTKAPTCGQPGRPINGTVTGGAAHPPGDSVSYSCVEGFVLFGEKTRTCLTNGSWAGEVPLCDFNVGAGKRSLQSGTLWSYSAGLAVDGSPDTCSFTPRGPDPRWWQVHLGHKFNVIRVAVTISPGSLQEFTIYVIELLADNKALYKPCTTFKGVFQTHKAVFLCNDGLGHPGQFVYIRDDRKEEEYFGLCEVEVFAFRERVPCGPPGVPLHGRVSVSPGERQAVYSCVGGYSLTGDATHTCSSRGKWEGQEPRCEEVRCPDPPSPLHGDVELQSPTGDAAPGTEARYTCRRGHTVRGNSSRECLMTGQWSGEQPACTRVSCGPPPPIPHARHTLLNATGLQHGVAVYTCEEGYRLDNASSDMVSSCLDSGTWKAVNITCVELPAATWHITDTDGEQRRLGTGRALNYEVEAAVSTKTSSKLPPAASPASESPLVLGLAIVASLLLVALLLLLSVFAVRRHYLTGGPGSLNPLLRSPIKRAVPATEGTGYFGGPPRPLERHYNDSMNNGNRTPMSSLYHHNLLRGLGVTTSTDEGLATQEGGSSLSGSISRLDEPPYERVRTRSEHSYETIRKLSQHVPHIEDQDDDSSYHQQQQVEPSYERLAGDKGSLWYESVEKASVGYETVPGDSRRQVDTTTNDTSCQIREQTTCDDCVRFEETKQECPLHKLKDPGYEKIKEKDHQYETLKEKDPGYESLRDKNDPGYETMTKESLVTHGYETVKPKPLDDVQIDTGSLSSSSISVPDILQDIEAVEAPEIDPTGTVPPEILALYAQVDKTKKRRKADPELVDQFPETSLESSATCSTASPRPTPPPRPKGMAPQPPSHPTLHHTYSDSTLGMGSVSSRGPQRYSRTNSDDLTRPPSAASDCTSPSGTLRPLPPIPKQ